MEQKKVKLKSCPFCGKEAKIIKKLYTHFGYASGFDAKIQCYYCKVKMDNSKLLIARKPNETADTNIERVSKMMGEHLDAAVKLWNTRNK